MGQRPSTNYVRGFFRYFNLPPPLQWFVRGVLLQKSFNYILWTKSSIICVHSQYEIFNSSMGSALTSILQVPIDGKTTHHKNKCFVLHIFNCLILKMWLCYGVEFSLGFTPIIYLSLSSYNYRDLFKTLFQRSLLISLDLRKLRVVVFISIYNFLRPFQF